MSASLRMLRILAVGKASNTAETSGCARASASRARSPAVRALLDGFGAVFIDEGNGPAVARPALQALAEAVGQIGGGFGARLKRDPARLVGNEAHTSFNIHQELAVAVGADQLDDMSNVG